MGKEILSHKAIIAIILSVILLWGIYWFFTFNGFQGWSERGQFGDMFGGLNALFSGLAFAGVIIAIILQKEELRLQREEMRRFAKAQEGSEEALKKQAEILISTAKLNSMNFILGNYKQQHEHIPNDKKAKFENDMQGVYLKVAEEVGIKIG